MGPWRRGGEQGTGVGTSSVMLATDPKVCSRSRDEAGLLWGGGWGERCLLEGSAGGGGMST